MNERFKELARQARYYANDQKAYLERIHNRELWVDEYQEMYDEKFAELMIMECAKTIWSAYSVDHKPMIAIAKICKEFNIDSLKLKEYFGVE
jgi:hypothetical protein